MSKTKPRRIHHVGIIVSDIERSIHFYTEILGFELKEIVETCAGETVEKGVGVPGAVLKIAHLQLEGSPTLIELLYYKHPRSRPLSQDAQPNDIGIAHAAFYVEEPERYYQKLKQNGVRFISPAVMESSTGEKFCYFHDPDGAVLEFLRPPDGPLKSLE